MVDNQREDKNNQPIPHEPLFNIPRVTGILMAILALIHLIRVCVLTPQQDLFFVYAVGFIPHRLSDLSNLTPSLLGINIMTMFTYMGLHIGWTHFLLNTMSLLAFGTAVERSMGGQKLLGLFVICGLAGVVTHFVAYPQSMVPVVGASAAISGLFGVILRIMQNMGRFKPGWRGLMPITIIWVGINIVFGLIGVVDDPSISVAWLAHIGGFLSGLLAFPLFNRKK